MREHGCRPGPAAERLRIEMDWTNAIKCALGRLPVHEKYQKQTAVNLGGSVGHRSRGECDGIDQNKNH